MKLMIQIPCYNEADTLEIALNDLPKEMDGIDVIDYVIINDGSTDNTEEVARNWGVRHIVNFKQNRGLAKGFMAGLDACLMAGADIIVNTDADNQYCADNIKDLIQPILEGTADIVIGERPINDTKHFSFIKKKMQHFGSWVVRLASGTNIPDAPSGFRAFSREAAMKMNVINDYTYTLETIVLAGRNKIPIISIPVRTNPELRKSRLFHSMWSYIKKSMLIILRTLIWYKPLFVFCLVALPPSILGIAFSVRFLYYFAIGQGSGHIQSLIFACTLLIIGFITFVIGLVADVMAANRKILEDTQYHIRKLRYDK